MIPTETIKIDEITVEDRIRSEAGDLDTLCDSIQRFGLIEPIILAKDSANPRLVAGGRRLAAMKRIGLTELQHARHFLWREEEYKSNDPNIRHFFVAMELEENLRRKELTWQEEVLGKQRLLETMQEIHGTAKLGGPTRAETSGAVTPGFGVNKLAAMLGESQGQTSKDLMVARYMSVVPGLSKAETKESAYRQLKILGAVISMKGEKQEQADEKLWTLYEGDFRDHTAKVSDGSVDLVYTDLPFGVDLSRMSKHGTGTVGYSDSRESIIRLLDEVASQAHRILREDRYAVFFFGFNYYTELLASLQRAGFLVNPVPVVWYKRTRSTENPNTRYANAYDPAIVAMKGSPVFIRPGRANVIEVAPVSPTNRLQIAQQPVELVEEFLKDMTTEGATIVDLMCGSGTTGVAAVKNKRRVILFEREPAACLVTKTRLEAMK